MGHIVGISKPAVLMMGSFWTHTDRIRGWFDQGHGKERGNKHNLIVWVPAISDTSREDRLGISYCPTRVTKLEATSIFWLTNCDGIVIERSSGDRMLPGIH